MQKQHIKPVHVPVSNKDFRWVGILRCLLAVNVEKHGMISGNVKKHLTTIHGWLNLGWHELFLGVSFFFRISLPFSHIFNQKSFNTCTLVWQLFIRKGWLIDKSRKEFGAEGNYKNIWNLMTKNQKWFQYMQKQKVSLKQIMMMRRK